jgi:hypothetical protein
MLVIRRVLACKWTNKVLVSNGNFECDSCIQSNAASKGADHRNYTGSRLSSFFDRRGETNFDVLITLTVPLSCVVFERSTTSVGFFLFYGAGKRGMRNPNKSTISY